MRYYPKPKITEKQHESIALLYAPTAKNETGAEPNTQPENEQTAPATALRIADTVARMGTDRRFYS
jgi:hypothetical protein